MQETTYQDLNEYRLAWIAPENPTKTHHGTFLFNSPEEARPAIADMERMFPTYAIWLEDKNKNMIEV